MMSDWFTIVSVSLMDLKDYFWIDIISMKRAFTVFGKCFDIHRGWVSSSVNKSMEHQFSVPFVWPFNFTSNIFGECHYDHISWCDKFIPCFQQCFVPIEMLVAAFNYLRLCSTRHCGAYYWWLHFAINANASQDEKYCLTFYSSLFGFDYIAHCLLF